MTLEFATYKQPKPKKPCERNSYDISRLNFVWTFPEVFIYEHWSTFIKHFRWTNDKTDFLETFR